MFLIIGETSRNCFPVYADSLWVFIYHQQPLGVCHHPQKASSCGALNRLVTWNPKRQKEHLGEQLWLPLPVVWSNCNYLLSVMFSVAPSCPVWMNSIWMPQFAVCSDTTPHPQRLCGSERVHAESNQELCGRQLLCWTRWRFLRNTRKLAYSKMILLTAYAYLPFWGCVHFKSDRVK